MHTTTIQISVRGEPKAQPRVNHFYNKKLGAVRTYTPGTAEEWKSLIAEAARDKIPESPLRGPTRVDISFRFKRPKSHYRTGRRSSELRPDAPTHHTNKPDRDNLDKAVLDVLVRIGMLVDDSVVCYGEISKWYDDANPGCTITVRSIPV